MEEQLIELVKERKMLWNLSHPLYKNIKRKAQAWEQISQILGVPAGVLRKKWKLLRDSYLRIRRRTVSGQAADDPDHNWKYESAMDFLKEHIKPRPTISNYTLLEIGGEERTPSVPPTTSIDVRSLLSPLPLSPQLGSLDQSPLTDRSEPSMSLTGKKRKAQTSIESTLLSTLESVQRFLETSEPGPATPQPALDEDEHFCRSLLAKLRTFPIEVRNTAKLQILRYANEVELEVLIKQNQD